MKQSIRQLAWILFLTCCGTTVKAQEKLQIENVRSTYIRNSGEIMDGEELKGYFSFFVSDKISKSENEYTLQILDKNLAKVKEIKFEDDKNIQVLESSYNGNAIMFLFYNKKEKTLEYRAYDFNGKQKMSYVKDLDKRSQALLESTYGSKSDEGQNEALFSVNNDGFVTVYPVKEKKYYSYEINFFFSNKRKTWTYEAAEDQEDKFAQAVYLGATDSLVLFEVVKQKSMMFSGGPHAWVVGLYIHNGKKAFEVMTEEDDHKLYAMNVATISGKSDFILMGPYYSPDAKVMKDASQGIGAWTMNSKGKVTAKKYNSWTGDIAKYLPVSSKGKIDNVGFIFFHKVLQMADGSFFAVGEGYKKSVSAEGVAGKVLSSLTSVRTNTSAFKVVITELLTFRFDENFGITDARIYEKNNNDMELPGGAEFMSPHVMALIAKAFGAFDYAFTITDKDHTRFNVGYTDYVRSGDEKGLQFKSLNYADGQMSEDKISLKSKAKWTRVFPAKPGFVTILEYFKKDKRLEYRLEKLN